MKLNIDFNKIESFIYKVNDSLSLEISLKDDELSIKEINKEQTPKLKKLIIDDVKQLKELYKNEKLEKSLCQCFKEIIENNDEEYNDNKLLFSLSELNNCYDIIKKGQELSKERDNNKLYNYNTNKALNSIDLPSKDKFNNIINDCENFSKTISLPIEEKRKIECDNEYDNRENLKLFEDEK